MINWPVVESKFKASNSYADRGYNTEFTYLWRLRVDGQSVSCWVHVGFKTICAASIVYRLLAGSVEMFITVSVAQSS